MDVKRIRENIKWFNNNKNLIYADTAATSLKPNCVSEAITRYYNEQSSNPHNNDSLFTNAALIKMEECRSLCADLINCKNDEIIFTSGTTESLNLIAQSLSSILKEGDEIILTKFEHASNLLPWYHLRDKLKIKIVFADIKKMNPKPEDFISLINDRTKVVSFTGTSNLIGLSFDVENISKSIKKINNEILICVDLAQMIPHKKCDIKKWDIDFTAFSAHKFFGPTGIGVAYIKKELQPMINPIRFGGGMNFSINKNNFCYIDGVAKYEGGTPNVAGMYGWIEAINFFNSIGYDNIRAHEKEIHNLLKKELSSCDHLEIYNFECESSTIAFNLKGVFCQDLASYLGKKGYIVRSGLSCAKLMDDVLPVDGLVRASFYIYNTLDEVRSFIDLLKNITKEEVLNEII